MRRRIVVAIVGMVAAALVLTGIGTILLSRIEARRSAQSDLRGDAQLVVKVIQTVTPLDTRAIRTEAPETPGAAARLQARRQVLNAFRNRFRLRGVGYLVIDNGMVVRDNRLPESLPPGRLDSAGSLADLQQGKVLSGVHGGTAWAAAPGPTTPAGRTGVVVLTRAVVTPHGYLPWFLIASGAVLVVAVLVALWLSRTLIRPLRQADVAARRIADGDLSARVPAPKPTADDELADLSRAINDMAGALERSRGLEQQFLLSVSHDLRTPLTSIRGYAEAITDGAATDTKAAAEVILTAARRLERLVADLLDLAKLDARAFTFETVALDPAEVAVAAAESLRPEAEAAGLTLAITRPQAVPNVQADRDRLSQVVANLVENALKYARSAVRVDTVVERTTVAIEVSDDGPGIAPDDLPHVFERLYVATSRPPRRESGSGLGLAIVRELATAMGASVAAETVAGGGTRIVVRFAAIPAATPAAAPPPEPVPGHRPSEP